MNLRYSLRDLTRIMESIEEEIDEAKLEKHDDINEETKEELENLENAQQVVEGATIKTEEIRKDTNASKPAGEIAAKELCDEEIPEVKINPRDEIELFLRERSLSESLIATLLKVGLTNEFTRLLTAIGFAEEDMGELENLWKMLTEEQEASSLDSESSSDGYLSPDGIFLKNSLSKPLKSALSEVVTTKPFDPVEYLGHWLLNYKICEERDRRQREYELEVMIERERFKSKLVEDGVETVFAKPEEEEENFADDWSFLNYE